MNPPSLRTFTHAAILLGVGLFALGGAALIPPLREIERVVVKKIATTIDPVDTILDGRGSQREPWTRRLAVPPITPPPPRVLEIDLDPDGWFSASPLAPIDHSGILRKLADDHHQVLGLGHLMTWEQPGQAELIALRKQLDRYSSAVLALPLARGATAEPVASPFLRWSMDAKDVRGKVSALPQVNRIAVPNLEQGGEKTLAGFSLLENEPDPQDGKQPLLAQWGSQVVFAFPLALEIAAQGLTPAEVRVELGKEIRLGLDGPVIPVDDFGRSPVTAAPVVVTAPAMRLVNEKSPLPAAPEPLFTRDVRADLPEAERLWSERLPSLIQSLRQAQRFQPATTLPRPDALLELVMIIALVALGTWATRQRLLGWRIVSALMLAGLGAQLLWLFASRQNLWLPPLAILSPGLTALGLAFWREKSAALPVSPAAEMTSPAAVAPAAVAPAPAAPLPTAPAPAPAGELPEVPRIAEPEVIHGPDEPAPRPARKAAAKKAPAKKVAKKAAKKAPAKKAAKRAPRKKPEDPETDAGAEP